MDSLDSIIVAIRELHKSQAKTDAQMAKTDERIAKTEALLAETIAERREMDKKWEKTQQILSNVGINLGIVAEEFFYYALEKKKKLGSIKFDSIQFNVRAPHPKVQDEFDIVMVNGNAVAIIEIKHKVHPSDIVKLKTKKLENFKAIFPQYADYTFYLGIGGLSVPAEIEEMAVSEGMAVLRQKGEVAEINDKKLVSF